MNGIFITGTDTNVGKTWVGTRLISVLKKKKIKLTIRKPVESGWDENRQENSDGYLLAKAGGVLDELGSVCPNHFSRPISPVRAALLEGKKLSISMVKTQCIAGLTEEQFLYVEGAGGFYSPLCADGLNADLAVALDLPVILVVENRLGCINQVLLNSEAIKHRGLNLLAVVLNDAYCSKKQDAMNNEADLLKMIDCPVIKIPYDDKSMIEFEKLASLVVVS